MNKPDNYSLAAMAYKTAKNLKTLYVMGGLGQPLTASNKVSLVSRYPYNESHSQDIYAASSDTFAFDCVCFIKSLINGFRGDPGLPYGGATYNAVIGDITCEQMIASCENVSADFSKRLQIGEIVYLPNHVGLVISISPALAAECTPKWDNKVQITAVNSDVPGYHRRDWKKHGTLNKYIEYKTTEVFSDVELPDIVKGSSGPAVKTMQMLLTARGFSCGPAGIDGKCGDATVEAIKGFQAANKDMNGKPLEVDGKCMALTWASLIRSDYNERL